MKTKGINSKNFFSPVKGLKTIYQNVPKNLERDFYHSILLMKWPYALASFAIFSLIMNSLFATMYWLGPNKLENSNGTWRESFLFSVQKFADIGYGHIVPNDLYSQSVSILQIFIGVTTFAIVTGYFFSKFSMTKSRLEFSDKMIISSYNGKRMLTVRMMNIRHNHVVNADVHVVFLKDQVTQSGEPIKVLIDMPINRSMFPVFGMCANIVHEIDEQSPFWNLNENNISDSSAEVLVTVTGVDGTFGQYIQSSKIYRGKDFVWNKQFANVLSQLGSDRIAVDYSKFNELQDA
jgi:inward rectifier potassium channel